MSAAVREPQKLVTKACCKIDVPLAHLFFARRFKGIPFFPVGRPRPERRGFGGRTLPGKGRGGQREKKKKSGLGSLTNCSSLGLGCTLQ